MMRKDNCIPRETSRSRYYTKNGKLFRSRTGRERSSKKEKGIKAAWKFGQPLPKIITVPPVYH
jgi:hypothetical protein